VPSCRPPRGPVAGGRRHEERAGRRPGAGARRGQHHRGGEVAGELAGVEHLLRPRPALGTSTPSAPAARAASTRHRRRRPRASVGRDASRVAARTISPGAACRHSAAGAGPMRAPLERAERPEEWRDARVDRLDSAAESRPRATPLWLETTPTRNPAATRAAAERSGCARQRCAPPCSRRRGLHQTAWPAACSRRRGRGGQRPVDALLGPFGAFEWSRMGPAPVCECRKPRPG